MCAVTRNPDGYRGNVSIPEMPNLTELILPGNLKYLGEEGLAYCYVLPAVNLPNSLTTIDVEDNYTGITIIRYSFGV